MADDSIHTHNFEARQMDATAVNLIAAHEKVWQIHQGQIPLPEVVELFISNHCTFACSHCRCARYHGGTTEFMTLSTLTKVLDELSARNVKTLEFGGGGEPLDHPEIGSILKLVAAEGFRAGMITNGYRFVSEPGLIEPLMHCGDWVRFSIDGVSDSVYREVHGRNDLSYQALREVIAVMAASVRKRREPEKRPKIGLRLLVQRPNEHQVLTAVDEAEALGVHYLQFKWLEEHSRSIPLSERPAIVAALQHRIAQISPSSLTVDLLPGYGGSSVQGRCLMSVLHPLIDWDGTIYLCAFFHHRKEGHSIGNVGKEPFFNYWGSARHREQIQGVDPRQCVPNCPLLRYNPVIDFIIREHYRFPYI